jgi:hypothetical protein
MATQFLMYELFLYSLARERRVPRAGSQAWLILDSVATTQGATYLGFDSQKINLFFACTVMRV